MKGEYLGMKPLRILVVDDDRELANSLEELLQDEGHEVELASSGEEALCTFRQQDFDITFMDVQMPGMSGVECLLEIRQIEPNAKVMMMSAYMIEELFAQAIELGSLGILRKPFKPEELLRVLDSVKPDGVVLVADDDPAFARSIEELLEDCGYRVVVACTGEQAVAVATTEDIDVLVLDLRLPVLSGLEVYLELKRRNRLVPTIVVTGYPEQEKKAAQQLKSLLVAGYLLKPFPPEELLRAVEKAMEGADGHACV